MPRHQDLRARFSKLALQVLLVIRANIGRQPAQAHGDAAEIVRLMNSAIQCSRREKKLFIPSMTSSAAS